MTHTDSTTGSFTSTSDWHETFDRDFSICSFLLWIPALLFLMRTEWFPSIVFMIVTPLRFVLDAVGVAEGLLHDKALGIAFALVALTLGSLVSTPVALLAVAIKHGVVALVRRRSRE